MAACRPVRLQDVGSVATNSTLVEFCPSLPSRPGGGDWAAHRVAGGNKEKRPGHEGLVPLPWALYWLLVAVAGRTAIRPAQKSRSRLEIRTTT